MRSAPLISVIVPIYKVEKYAEDCIRSIISQTYKNLEIILVVGEAEDSCEEICHAFANKDNRIKVLVSLPKGLSDARNQGIEVARGDYLGFVDGDDWIEADMYETLLRILLENDADISVCGKYVDYVNSDRSEPKKEDREYCISPQEGIESILYMKNVRTSAWDKLYKAELFSNIRYPVGRTCEDFFTTYKLFDKAKKIAVTSCRKYHYRVRRGSLVNTYNTKSQIDVDDSLAEIEEFIKEKYPLLMPAVNSIYVRRYFACLRHNVENKEINSECAKQAVENIRSRAWKVIWDRKSTLMAKAVAVIGSCGIIVTRFFLMIFDHRANKSF